jgi:outer membrane protein assembly factor BamB
MLKKVSRVIFGLFVPLALCLSRLACRIDSGQLFPEQTIDRLPLAVENRTISRDFAEMPVWLRDDIFIRRGLEPSPGLLAGHGYVAFVNFLGGPLSQINRLDVLDANIGTTLWQTERFPDHESVAISKDRVLVLLNEGSPLNIYSIKDGSKPLRSLNYFKEATQFYIFPPVTEGNVYIYYQQGNEYSLHSIDLEGQEVGNPRRIQISGRHPPLFLFNELFFLKTGEGKYTGANFETGEELWHISAPGRIDSWPVLQNDTLIISAGDGLRYLLMAIDIENGRKLWETDKVFGSNVVLHKGSLYALRNDAVLVKLDFTNGQVEEEIPFEPVYINAGKWAYWLASDGERLFVYFGDSQELFALRP